MLVWSSDVCTSSGLRNGSMFQIVRVDFMAGRDLTATVGVFKPEVKGNK